MKKFQSLIALLLCAVLLCACGKKEDPIDSQPAGTTAGTLPAEQTYAVTVLDYEGNPVTGGVVVNFIRDGAVAAMQIVNGQGVAEKLLPTGDYTVELGFTDSSVSYYFDKTDLNLTGEKTALTVVLSQALSDESLVLSAYSQMKGEHMDYEAHYIGTGSTHVPLNAPDRTYVLFVPQQSGIYEFSVLTDGVSIGYYGNEHYVLQNNAAENADEQTFTMNVSKGMIGTEGGTAVMVLGLDGKDVADCVVRITRIADAELTIDDYPWDVYQNTVTPSAFTLPDNVTIRDFDMKAPAGSYELVKDSNGCYRLGSADGFMVYARLGSASAYLDAIESILENTNMCKFVFDDNGNFLSKENYTQALKEYIAVMDEVSGLYPLTDDIIYMFQSHGEYVGWWDPDSPSYLFEDINGDPIAGINNEHAWLFLCCYGETDPNDPCKDGHTELTDAAKAPTCTADGLSEGKHCTVCGKVTVEQQKLPATGHSYSDWVEVKAPTADAEGKAERKCKTCGHVQTKTLDKLGSSDPGTDPDPDPDPKPVKEVGTAANADAPVELFGRLALSFDAEVKAGQYVVHHIFRLTDVYLTIEDEYAYVVYEGKTYWPENGKISVLITNESFNYPAEVWIGNWGLEDRTIHADCLYPLGHMENPKTLTMGQFSTTLEAGNDQGYYYSYTATSDGTLTISLDNVPSGLHCSIELQNLSTGGYEKAEDGSISIAVKAGQKVRITIGLFNDSFQFPGGIVKTTAKFE